jgi:hypothetical protein
MNQSTDTQNTPNIPDIENEIDEPLPSMAALSSLQPATLSDKQVKTLEQQKFEHGKEIDTWAVRLLIGFVIAFIGIYIFERIIGHIWYDPTIDSPNSNLSNLLVETLKFLISSLIGFLFAKRTI